MGVKQASIERFHYPTNRSLARYAVVSKDNNQVWHYWCTRLGLDEVLRITREIREYNEATFYEEDRDNGDFRATFREFKEGIGLKP